MFTMAMNTKGRQQPFATVSRWWSFSSQSFVLKNTNVNWKKCTVKLRGAVKTLNTKGKYGLAWSTIVDTRVPHTPPGVIYPSLLVKRLKTNEQTALIIIYRVTPSVRTTPKQSGRIKTRNVHATPASLRGRRYKK